jgi:4-amino-4-deoxy-L-arabinose transferase-like glycosyltransferase
LDAAGYYFDALKAGHPSYIFFAWTQYPPLAHAVGALGAVVAGPSIQTFIMSSNIVFVPLLAVGTYGAGREVAGPAAGALAALFALGTPMILGLFHLFMLDPPEAAMVAVSVWLLLASRRFSSAKYTVLAAFAVAAGFYVKSTFVIFVAGLGLALLLRGGWRHWRHVLMFGAIVLILIEPWYFNHFQDLRGLTQGAVVAVGTGKCGEFACPARWSIVNFSWYAWDLLSVVLYFPLALFVLTGLVTTLGVAQIRERLCYVPDLLAGLLFSYLGISYLNLDDPRYILPALVYLAVLGTAWIANLRLLVRVPATVALIGVVVTNAVLISFGLGQPVSHRLYTSKEISFAGYVTIAAPNGYTASGPRHGVRDQIIQLLKEARIDGKQGAVFQPETLNAGPFNLNAMALFARLAGLEVPGFAVNVTGPDDVYVARALVADYPHPCLDLHDGYGIYMFEGPPTPGKPFYCPPHRG